MKTQLVMQVEERIKSRFHPTNPTSSTVACDDPISRMVVTAKPLTHRLRSTHTDKMLQGEEKAKKKKNHPDTFSNNGVMVEEAL